MIRLVRITGFLLMVVGALVILTWLFDPLRQVWERFWPWLRSLPGPIQLGLVMAAVGFLLLFGSLLWERIEDREGDKALRDDP